MTALTTPVAPLHVIKVGIRSQAGFRQHDAEPTWCTSRPVGPSGGVTHFVLAYRCGVAQALRLSEARAPVSRLTRSDDPGAPGTRLFGKVLDVDSPT